MGRLRAALRRTTSRVKKAFFDIVGERIKEAVFLDLYAGEGGMGIEALKRGASSVVFVEVSKRNAMVINRKLRELKNLKAIVYEMEVIRFLRDYSGKASFDIVFADPPYESSEYEPLMCALPLFRGLKGDTLICIEHFHKRSLPEKAGSLVLLKRYRYGDTLLSFYRRQDEEGSISRHI